MNKEFEKEENMQGDNLKKKLKEEKTKKTYSKKILVCSLIGAVLLSGGITGLATYLSLRPDANEQKLLDILKILKEDWLYEKEVDDVETYISDLMLSNLNLGEHDKYLNYAVSMEDMGLTTESSKKSFGASFNLTDDGLEISTLYDGALSKAGLEKNDRITKISYKTENSTYYYEYDKDTALEFYEKLLTIENYNSSKDYEYSVSYYNYDIQEYREAIVKLDTYKEFSYTIERQNLMRDNSRLIIRIDNFLGNVYSDVNDYLSEVKKDYGKINNLVIDLNNNPGGYTDEAINLASLFLNKGSPITGTLDKNEKFKNQEKQVRDPLLGPNDLTSIRILTNSNTASASELFTSALVGNSRARSYGQKSYGKGISQSVIQFKDGSVFKYTSGEVVGVSSGILDNRYHGKGLNPTYKWELDPYIFKFVTNNIDAFAANDTNKQRFITIVNNYIEKDSGTNPNYTSYEEALYEYAKYKDSKSPDAKMLSSIYLDSTHPEYGIKMSRTVLNALSIDSYKIFKELNQQHYDEVYLYNNDQV